MCLVIFAYRKHPRYPLLLAANRDEFHARATAPARFWKEQPQLLAGRDLEAGGTWMGITREGRFAAITNFRDPARTAPGLRSRGELPLRFLLGRESPHDCLLAISTLDDDYAGFNLLLGDSGALWYYSNSLPGEERRPRQLPPGIYGLSNAHLDTPWPKVVTGKARMSALLGGRVGHDRLGETVSDVALAEETALHPQGLSGEMDRLLSAQFIVTPSYGTRATTTLWLEDGGVASWRECSFDATGLATGTVTEQFEIAR